MATSSSELFEGESRPTSSSTEFSSSSQTPRPWRRRSSEERRSSPCFKSDSLIGCRREAKLTPFYLRWSFGVNKAIPVVNLTLPNRPLLFYASSHAGVLYDDKSTEMRLLHGHQNAITSISANSSGRWVVTADAGEDGVIIVWDTEKCIPICTLFGYEKSGVRIVGLSPNAKYMVAVSNEACQSVSIWLWTYGKDESEDETLLDPDIGNFKKIEFNPENSTQFILMSDSHMVFMTWVDKEKPPVMKVHIPETKFSKAHGVLTDLTYLKGTHQALSATSNGYVISWSDVPYVQSFLPGPASNEKKWIKVIHLQKDSINVICSVDDLVVTGNSAGHIRFYDNHLLLLYWCQSFSLDSITGISFNLSSRQYTLKETDDYIPEPAFMKDSSKFPYPNPLESGDEDRYEGFEELYRNMVPSDATLARKPIVSRDFVVSTATGQIGLVDFLENVCNFILQKSEAFISAMDTHPEKNHICIGNKAGALFLYNYRTKVLLVKSKIPATTSEAPEDDSDNYKSICCLKYDPAGFVLACGMRDGSIWFLHPTLLTPVFTTASKHSSSPITKICFSPDSKFLAHIDEGMRVCLYRCENMDNCEWIFIGKQRSHYKPITDILFSELSSPEPLRLFSIGEDRMLIEYDLINSSEDDLKILNTERIEQSAVPLCMAWYPRFTNKTFLFTANSEFKYKTLDIETKMCAKTVLGPPFGSPVHFIQDNERLVHRIQQVRKLLRRSRKERKFLMDRLDQHGDNWRNVQLPIPLDEPISTPVATKP